MFSSTTALVQHCESPANRCNIRETGDYNQALDTITGGLLEVKERKDDGQVEYQAAKVEW